MKRRSTVQKQWFSKVKQMQSSFFCSIALYFGPVQKWSADLLQHGHVSNGPALEGGSGVTLNLYELILLSLWSLNVGHLRRRQTKLNRTHLI